MNRAIVATILLASVAMAGCSEPNGTNGPNPSMGFDGAAAFALLEDIVYEDDGALRPRTPGSAGHQETDDWLASQLAQSGWTVHLDGFSGTDYQDLDKGGVTAYYDQSRYCGTEDREQLPDIAFTNVFATFGESLVDDGHVVLAAHWDAKEDAHSGDGPIPAANDGASGVAVLLQLQRHIAEQALTFPFALTIALFDGEDGFEDCHPLAGSLWAARTGSIEGISQLILLDMVGDADARFIRETLSTNSDPDLVDAIWSHAATTDLADNFVASGRTITDDHLPFIEEGIPAIDIVDGGRSNVFPPYWHTMEDTPDKLSADMLGDMGDLMLWMLTDPATQALFQD